MHSHELKQASMQERADGQGVIVAPADVLGEPQERSTSGINSWSRAKTWMASFQSQIEVVLRSQGSGMKWFSGNNLIKTVARSY